MVLILTLLSNSLVLSIKNIIQWRGTYKKIEISGYVYCSIGNQEFFYGAVSLLKNLQTNYSEIKMIMEKAGKCLYIMVLISSITSLFPLLSRMIFSNPLP